MEEDLILNYNHKLDKKSLLEARELTFKKLNKSFLFKLSDGYCFFISYNILKNAPQKQHEKIIIKPQNNQISKILKMVDQDILNEYVVLLISGYEQLPLMHLINALVIVFRNLKISLFNNFKAYGFKIIEDEKNKKFVLDTDLTSSKEVLVVKSGKTDIFLVESIGEIEKNLLCEIVESCF